VRSRAQAASSAQLATESPAESAATRGDASSPAYRAADGRHARPELDRVAERRRAVALARHYRDAEQLPVAEIARSAARPRR